jgi:hypothetical protein
MRKHMRYVHPFTSFLPFPWIDPLELKVNYLKSVFDVIAFFTIKSDFSVTTSSLLNPSYP